MQPEKFESELEALSVGANADKRHAVMTLLRDEEWAQWSDREIARRCAVSKSFVSNMRPSLSTNASEAPARTYTNKHGTTTTMNTQNIGRRHKHGTTRTKQ